MGLCDSNFDHHALCAGGVLPGLGRNGFRLRDFLVRSLQLLFQFLIALIAGIAPGHRRQRLGGFGVSGGLGGGDFLKGGLQIGGLLPVVVSRHTDYADLFVRGFQVARHFLEGFGELLRFVEFGLKLCIFGFSGGKRRRCLGNGGLERVGVFLGRFGGGHPGGFQLRERVLGSLTRLARRLD